MNYWSDKLGILDWSTKVETTSVNLNSAKLATVWLYAGEGTAGTLKVKVAAVDVDSKYLTIGSVTLTGAETGEDLISTLNIDSSVNPFVKVVADTLVAGEVEVYISYN